MRGPVIGHIGFGGVVVIVLFLLILAVLDGGVGDGPGYEEHGGDGEGTEDPVGDEIGQQGGPGQVERRGDGPSERLDRFEEACVPGQFVVLIGEGAHEPVAVDSKGGVAEAKHPVDGNQCCVLFAFVETDETLRPGEGFAIPFVLDLHHERREPCRHEEDSNEKEANDGSTGSFDRNAVEHVTDDDGADDLCDPKDSRVERTSTNVEGVSVKVVELVGVRKVGKEEGWNEEEHPPVAKDGQDS